MMVRIEYEGGRTTLFDTLSFMEGSPFSAASCSTATRRLLGCGATCVMRLQFALATACTWVPPQNR